MSIIVNLFLMAYLLVMILVSVAALFWATLLIFKPGAATKKELVRHSHDAGMI